MIELFNPSKKQTSTHNKWPRHQIVVMHLGQET